MRYLLLLLAYTAQAATYEDDVRPIFARRCFQCHSAAEMRSGLSLESYAGVMKGGSSGDAVKPGRASTSLLYQAVAHEGEGIPYMPQGGGKLPDVEIATIREWIAGGVLENAKSAPKGPVSNTQEFKPVTLNKPAGTPAMPGSLAPVTLSEPARAHPVTALASSPWSPLAAVAGHERIYLYDTEKRTLIGELPFPEGIPYALRFSRDGAKLLAAGGRGMQGGRAVIYDVRTGKRLAVFGQEFDIILAADLSADGSLVALGGPSKVVRVYSVADGKKLYELKKHTDWITALEFSPDGKELATADRAGGLHLWESLKGGIIVTLTEHKDSITSVSWRADGNLLASGGEDGALIIWDTHDGFSVASVQKAHEAKAPKGFYGKIPNGVLSVQFLPDGRLATVGRDRAIKLWGSDGKPRATSPASDALLTKVAAGFDSKTTFAGDYEGHLLLWDGTKMQVINPPGTAVAKVAK